jgi:glycosyltransferase involved in cell wall biosynthesis
MNIFCIIPAYNEEKNIFSVLNNVKKHVDQVVVVDDGSVDKTYELAEKIGAIVLRHIVNRGQGAALRTGTEYALKNGADIIVHFDADGQFLAEEIKAVIHPIESGEAKIVFGSRFLEKKSHIPFLKKYFIMPLAMFFISVMGVRKITDPQSGFRALSRKAAEAIKIEHDGMAHCSEILVKTFKNKLKFKEVSVTVIYNEFGQRFGGGVRIIKDIFIKKIIS